MMDPGFIAGGTNIHYLEEWLASQGVCHLMFELILLCAQEQVEIISEALLALDALSVSVEDADAHTDQEQALFGEPGMPVPEQAWLRSHLIALFADQACRRASGTAFAGCKIFSIKPVLFVSLKFLAKIGFA
jgi:ribosomal protein L11 methyltransferase